MKKQETLDYAKRTITTIPWEGAPTTRDVSAEQVNRIKALADAAWRGPKPKTDSHIHDYLEIVIIFDGPDVFVVSAGMKLEEETSLGPLIRSLH